MAQQTTKLTEEQLRNEGASAAFIAYYTTAKEMGIDTAATRHVEARAEEGNWFSGGGFYDSLWEDNPRWGGDNPYGADTQNQRILAEAGVSPYDKA